MTIWSIATKQNVTCRQSTIGRKPQPAAPIAMPVSAASVIGVALIRCCAELLAAAARSRRSTCRRSSDRAASPRRSLRARPRCMSALASSDPRVRPQTRRRSPARAAGTGLPRRRRRPPRARAMISPSIACSPASSRSPWSRSCRSSSAIGSFCFHASTSAWSRGSGWPAALGMGAPAVGLALDQRRAAAGARPLHGGARRLIDREDVVAVDHDARNAVAGGARRHIAQARASRRPRSARRTCCSRRHRASAASRSPRC